MKRLKQFILKLVFNVLSWIGLQLMGGYPPIKDKEKMRSWTLTNIENRAMPLALCTETKIDDEIWKIVKQVVENDVQWDVLYELLLNRETVPDSAIEGTETKFLSRMASIHEEARLFQKRAEEERRYLGLLRKGQKQDPYSRFYQSEIDKTINSIYGPYAKYFEQAAKHVEGGAKEFERRSKELVRQARDAGANDEQIRGALEAMAMEMTIAQKREETKSGTGFGSGAATYGSVQAYQIMIRSQDKTASAIKESSKEISNEFRKIIDNSIRQTVDAIKKIGSTR